MNCIEKFQSFLETSKCLRVSILEYFNETPTFKYCNRCSVCENRNDSSVEIRDFTVEIRTLLQNLIRIGNSSKSKLAKSFSKLPYECLDSILLLLVQRGLVCRSEAKHGYGAYQVYGATLSGKRFVKDKNLRIEFAVGVVFSFFFSLSFGSILDKNTLTHTTHSLAQVPKVILQREKLEKEKIKMRMNELLQAGIDLSHIPQEEIEAGYRGPVIKLTTQWFSRLERLRLRKNVSSLEANQEFIKRIRTWSFLTHEFKNE